ncbi:MAG: acyl carrier protein [Bacillota bacterium]|nr:acyl carrier protein [Bacillota bacterium]
MDLFNRVKSVISQLFIYDGVLCMETRIAEDLGADSFDYTKLMSYLEEEFEIEISPDEFNEVKNLGDIVSLVEKKAA